MNILIDIGHPGHVHLFRNTYFELKQKGHNVIVTTKDVPIILDLLQKYGIDFIVLGKKPDGLFLKGLMIIIHDIKLLGIVLKNKIRVGISSGLLLSHVSIISPLLTIICDDDDDKAEPLFVKFGHALASTVLSPYSIIRKTNKNLSYFGTHELAYLHPKRFTPDNKVLRKVGINEADVFFLLRFVAFKGHHDIGHHGISTEQKIKIISILEKKGKVFITSERAIEPELEMYRLKISPDDIHSLIFYSTMFIGDSQTMTSEAAILGVPALKCNTFAGKLSVPNMLEFKYRLCYSYLPEQFDDMLFKIEELLTNPNLKSMWQEKRQVFLEQNIDVTSYFTWFIENYPESKILIEKDPSIQMKFK